MVTFESASWCYINDSRWVPLTNREFANSVVIYCSYICNLECLYIEIFYSIFYLYGMSRSDVHLDLVQEK